MNETSIEDRIAACLRAKGYSAYAGGVEPGVGIAAGPDREVWWNGICFGSWDALLIADCDSSVPVDDRNDDNGGQTAAILHTTLPYDRDSNGEREAALMSAVFGVMELFIPFISGTKMGKEPALYSGYDLRENRVVECQTKDEAVARWGSEAVTRAYVHQR